MAGTFTHWMVAEQALEEFHNLPHAESYPYFPDIVSDHIPFVILGAVGPDYPYLTDFANHYLKTHSWADRMHYENTSGVIKYGLTNLAGYVSNNQEQELLVCLSWLCGYASHVITDSIIHPVVNEIVGPYIFNSEEHRKCEMVQDSFIFKELKGDDLLYGGYSDMLKRCSDPANVKKIHPVLNNFWSSSLKMSHPSQSAQEKYEDIDPDEWHENFLSRISSAAQPVAIMRGVESSLNLVYRLTKDIPQEEKIKYYSGIKLPGSKIGNFRKDAFDKTVSAVVDIWQKILVDTHNGDYKNCSTYLRDWNLDTGVDDDKLFFWG